MKYQELYECMTTITMNQIHRLKSPDGDIAIMTLVSSVDDFRDDMKAAALITHALVDTIEIFNTRTTMTPNFDRLEDGA